jgi:hypothetical protein
MFIWMTLLKSLNSVTSFGIGHRQHVMSPRDMDRGLLFKSDPNEEAKKRRSEEAFWILGLRNNSGSEVL